MIITIDTSKDSHEEIRRAILLLKQIVGEYSEGPMINSGRSAGSVNSNNSYNSQQSVYNNGSSGSAVGNFFDFSGNSSQSVNSSNGGNSSNVAPDTGGFVAMFGDMQPSSSSSDFSNSSQSNSGTKEPLPKIIGLPESDNYNQNSTNGVPRRRVNYDFETYE